MSERILRQQILREAEGYLELVSLMGDAEAPPSPACCRLTERALTLLDRLPAHGVNRAKSQFLRGQALRTLGRFDEAIAPLKKATDIEPENIEGWLGLGWCHKRTGRLDLAVEALEEALAIAPSKAIIHYNLACYWSLAGKVQQALKYLSQALAMDSLYRGHLDSEHDFDPIRNDPGFQALTSVIV